MAQMKTASEVLKEVEAFDGTLHIESYRGVGIPVLKNTMISVLQLFIKHGRDRRQFTSEIEEDGALWVRLFIV